MIQEEDSVADNGEMPDVMDELVDTIPAEEEDVPADPETAIVKRSTARPSMDDALISGGGTQFSPIQAVLKASEEPLEYLVRSWLTAQEADLLILDNSMRHAAVRGRVNPALDDFLFLTLRRSVDGPNNAMRMAKEMYMGRQAGARDDRREGVLARMTTLNQEQIEQNGSQR